MDIKQLYKIINRSKEVRLKRISMIKKSILIFIALFVCYNVILWLVPGDMGIEITSSDLQYNITKSEFFLYDVPDLSTKSVLIGTSLTGRIKEEYLGDSYLNLGLDGFNVDTGLELLTMKDNAPLAVLIEVNMLTRQGKDSKAFLTSLLGDKNFNTAKFVPSSRNVNRPLIFFRRLLYGLYIRVVGENRIQETEKPIKINQERLRSQHTQFSKTVSDEEMANTFRWLEHHVDRLLGQNSQIVFYEVPWHISLCESNMIFQLRKRIQARFPQITYLIQPDCKDYRTYDPIHLTEVSGKKFALYMKNELNLLTKIENK